MQKELVYLSLIHISVLLAAATVLANVGLLAVSAVLISLAALQPPLLDLMVYIVGVRFFGISRALLRYSERYVSHKITFQILTRLRVQIYQCIEPKDVYKRQIRRCCGILIYRLFI